MNKETFLNKLDKFNSFLEGACEGLTIMKELLESDDDSSPKLPVIPNYDEVEQYFEKIDDMYSREAVALRTYRVFADSMSCYASFLVEESDLISNENAFSEQFEKDSIKFILGVLYELHLVFDVFQKIKLGSDQYNEFLEGFHFTIALMCSDAPLNELYDVEFFDDLSELWEVLVGMVDMVNAKYGAPLFSEFLNKFYENWTVIEEYTLSVLNSDCSRWTKKRVLKKYVKAFRDAAKKMSNTLQIQASFLRQRL